MLPLLVRHQYYRILFRHFLTSQNKSTLIIFFSQNDTGWNYRQALRYGYEQSETNSQIRKENLCQAINKSKVF